MKPRAKAFTLIELLVVICILGILMGLLIPALFGAKTAARIGQAKTTISLLVQALKAYEEDWGKYPMNPSDDNFDNLADNASALVGFLDGNKFNGSGVAKPWKTLPGNLSTVYLDFKITDIGGFDNDDPFLKDPWGNDSTISNAYRYAWPGTPAHGNQTTFDVWSTGPDGVSGNTDDIGNW